MCLLFLQNFARFLIQGDRSLSFALCAIGQRLRVAKIAKDQIRIVVVGTAKSIDFLLALIALASRALGNAIVAIPTTCRVAAV
jgi:hypothetical protein